MNQKAGFGHAKYKKNRKKMLIDYRNVNIYQADKCVLANVNFHIDEGEFAYIIGKVGSD